MMADYKQINWTPENIAKFWDYESQFPQNYFTFQFGGAIVRKLKKYLYKSKTILDYGCGTGFLIPYLLNLGLKVTGVDYSAKSIVSVNEKFKGREHFEGAFLVNDLINKDQGFDAIIAIEVIEHLTDEFLEKEINNIKKLLEPNGVIIFTTPNEEYLEDSHIFCPECEHIFHRWQHVRSWSNKSLTDCMQKHGLKVIDCYATDFSSSLKCIAKKILNKKLPHLVCICAV